MRIDRTRPVGALVIGRAGMDFYALPDGAAAADATSFFPDVGGSSANIAVGLARQGVAVSLVTPISNDAVGQFVRANLQRYGVNTDHCREVGGDLRTSLAVVATRPDAKAVIYRNGAADLALEATDLDASALRRCSVMIVTGTALAREPSRSAVASFLRAARSTGTFTILDVDHRPYSWASETEAGLIYSDAAKLADAVIGNDEEFAILAGGRHSAVDEARALVAGGAAFAIVKHGEKGALTILPEEEFETPVFPVAMLKPIGAGDAFMGGVVAAVLAGSPMREAVIRGSAAAAHVVGQRGCASAMPNPAAIDAIIARHAPRRS